MQHVLNSSALLVAAASLLLSLGFARGALFVAFAGGALFVACFAAFGTAFGDAALEDAASLPDPSSLLLLVFATGVLAFGFANPLPLAVRAEFLLSFGAAFLTAGPASDDDSSLEDPGIL